MSLATKFANFVYHRLVTENRNTVIFYFSFPYKFIFIYTNKYVELFHNLNMPK